jgi:hypothetical protein
MDDYEERLAEANAIRLAAYQHESAALHALADARVHELLVLAEQAERRERGR